MEEEEKYDDPNTPDFYHRLTQQTLMDIDLTYSDEIIRIFQEFKQNEDIGDRQDKLFSNPEVNSGVKGGVILKKRKNKNAHMLNVPKLSPDQLIYSFLEWI